MSENQFCGAADADGSPSSGVGAEEGNPFLDVVDVVGGNPFCDAVGVGDASPICGAAVDAVGESPSCGAVDEAPTCFGWCGTELTEAGAVADGTDQ